MDSGAIILGFTGSIGSGCTTIAIALSKAESGYRYFKLSDIIREHLKKEHKIENPTVEQLQNAGDELRKKFGREYLAKILCDELKKQSDINEIIIDGIKNVGEVEYLRYFPFFFLFSVQADGDIRMERCCQGSNRIFDNPDLFLQADLRDQDEDDVYGQQVRGCNQLADIIKLNNADVPTYPASKREDYAREIYRKYVYDIENLRSGGASPESRPSVYEFSMTAAHAASRLSSCEKRKVGAVIVELQEERSIAGSQSDEKVSVLPDIISIGYNEVPLGAHKCVYHPEFHACYRDHRQERYAQKLHFCPGCGQRISFTSECPRCQRSYHEFKKVCPDCHGELAPKASCGCDIAREFIPGGKQVPGKLLDLCRAVHAEEKALMNLLRRGANPMENLILFTTTQPCNLCANKIVTAGIKKVVFDEPYFMEEAANILISGNVEVGRFEGVKSSAYFRLYR